MQLRREFAAVLTHSHSHRVQFALLFCRKRVALPRGAPRLSFGYGLLHLAPEHIGDTKLGAWRWSNFYNLETNRRIIAGKGIF